MSREAFGPNLRRIRMQRHLSVEQIANATKVAASLLHGLERNDFSNWPAGVYARAFVRQYADAIGVDADSTVDEFCRWFPHGDRRIERTIREQAEIVGHEDLTWEDVPPGDQINRRGAQLPRSTVDLMSQSPFLAWIVRLRRVIGRA